MTRKFSRLLEPGNIGNVKTKNRMVKTAAGMCYCDADKSGYISERELFFYEAIAKGGIGLAIVGAAGVDFPIGTTRPGNLHLEHDKYIQSYLELTRVIHKYSCPTFLQLFHCGPGLVSDLYNMEPISSSALIDSEQRALAPAQTRPLRGLTIAEVEGIISKFVSAAQRARNAGFDGVEINASSGHLLNSFLSRAWNKRQDAYGYQDLNSRTRIVVEILREIKKQQGQDFPVTVQINVAEYGHDKGTTIEEGQEIARILVEAGADGIQARANGFGSYGFMTWPEWVLYPEPPKPLPEGPDWSQWGAGAEVPMAAAVKKAVSKPVIAVGRLNPVMGEKILTEGKADFIGFVRSLIADPELPNKLASGRFDDIAPCTACHTCLTNAINEPARCRINAEVSGKQEYSIKPSNTHKKVLVVGGGPAGLEAARVSALRGHEVFLYEKERRLGGLLPLAGLVKGFEIENLEEIVCYLKRQITKLGVNINLGQEVNQSLIGKIKPDVLILAVGGIPAVPDIKGINNRKVISSHDLHKKLKFYMRFMGPQMLRRLTKNWMPLGRRVVIIGSGIQGCELAEFLVKRGRKVTIVDATKTVGEGLVPDAKLHLLRWLAKKDVPILTGVTFDEITNKGLTIINKEGKRQTIEADNIVPALPLKSNTALLKNPRGDVPKVYAIGDCNNPRLIVDAIADGYNVGCNI